jgi:hypothetical protein
MWQWLVERAVCRVGNVAVTVDPTRCSVACFAPHCQHGSLYVENTAVTQGNGNTSLRVASQDWLIQDCVFTRNNATRVAIFLSARRTNLLITNARIQGNVFERNGAQQMFDDRG